MKLSHLISIILISALVGIASNLSYSFLTTRRPSQDQIDFKNLLDEDWEHTLQENPYFASLLGDLDLIIKSHQTLQRNSNQTQIMREHF